MGRVVITGVGAISPIGNSFEEVMEGIRDGKRGIGNIQSIDTGHFPSNLGAEVKENGNPQPQCPNGLPVHSLRSPRYVLKE